MRSHSYHLQRLLSFPIL